MTSGREVTSGRVVTSGGLGESLPVTWSLPGVWGLVARSLPIVQSLPGDWGVTSGEVTWAKTMVVTSISHMGEMRDSDWSRPNFLRSDWLPTI